MGIGVAAANRGAKDGWPLHHIELATRQDDVKRSRHLNNGASERALGIGKIEGEDMRDGRRPTERH